MIDLNSYMKLLYVTKYNPNILICFFYPVSEIFTVFICIYVPETTKKYLREH